MPLTPGEIMTGPRSPDAEDLNPGLPVLLSPAHWGGRQSLTAPQTTTGSNGPFSQLWELMALLLSERARHS